MRAATLYCLSLPLVLAACASSSPPAPMAPGPLGSTAAAASAASAAGGCTDAVRVFTEEGFAGDTLDLAPGRHDVDHLDGTAVPNDSIAAVCVPPGWTVTLYWDGGFAGDTKVLTESVGDLTDWSRSTSAIEVVAPE